MVRLRDTLRRLSALLGTEGYGGRRDLGRIAVQTAAAVTVTYAAGTWLGLDQMSWALISALFTIGLSADSSWVNAGGRVAGSVLGVALGLGALLLPGHEVLIGVVLATTAANVLATARPALRYAAVTAAVVALGPQAGASQPQELVGAILFGSAVGAAATLLVWPEFGRKRTEKALRAALEDCKRLLVLIEKGVATDEHRERDEVHSSFVRHLETARSRLAETRIRPWLPSGAPLREAVDSAERLWLALFLLDRAVTDGRPSFGAEELRRLKHGMTQVQRAAHDHLDRIIGAMHAPGTPAPDDSEIDCAVAAAIGQIDSLLAGSGSADAPRADEPRALHALAFALNEVRGRLSALRVLARRPQPS